MNKAKSTRRWKDGSCQTKTKTKEKISELSSGKKKTDYNANSNEIIKRLTKCNYVLNIISRSQNLKISCCVTMIFLNSQHENGAHNCRNDLQWSSQQNSRPKSQDHDRTKTKSARPRPRPNFSGLNKIKVSDHITVNSNNCLSIGKQITKNI